MATQFLALNRTMCDCKIVNCLICYLNISDNPIGISDDPLAKPNVEEQSFRSTHSVAYFHSTNGLQDYSNKNKTGDANDSTQVVKSSSSSSSSSFFAKVP